MAKNWVQKGHTVTCIAPNAGVTAGVLLLIGALPVVPDITVSSVVATANDTPFEGHTGGVWDFNTKVSADDPTEYVPAYLTPGGALTVDGDAGNFLVGVFVSSGGNGSTACRVRLDGVAVTAVPA